MDSVWANSFGAVVAAVSGILEQFLRMVGAFSSAFELLFSLTIIYFVVIRLVPSSGFSGSDKAKRSSKEEKKES